MMQINIKHYLKNNIHNHTFMFKQNTHLEDASLKLRAGGVMINPHYESVGSPNEVLK